MRRVVLLCAALFAGALNGSAQDACFTVPIELQGPIENVRFEALGVQSVVRVELAAGETRTLTLPFGGGSVAGLEPSAAAAALQVHAHPPEGTAKVRSREASGPGSVSRGLGRRGRPPVAPSRPLPDRARWLTLIAGAVVLVGVRKRPFVCVATGAVTAALMLVLPAAPLGGRSMVGIDGDAARGRWLEVRSANERLELAARPGGWFEVRGIPAGEWIVDAEDRWVLSAAGGEVHSLRESTAVPLDPTTGRPIHALRELWTRTADGRWTALRDWRPGEDFPPPAATGSSATGPAGWLAAGLPQGVNVLVATPVGPAAPDWLRITGWPGLESAERR
jgi:hypothetical protein